MFSIPPILSKNYIFLQAWEHRSTWHSCYAFNPHLTNPILIPFFFFFFSFSNFYFKFYIFWIKKKVKLGVREQLIVIPRFQWVLIIKQKFGPNQKRGHILTSCSSVNMQREVQYVEFFVCMGFILSNGMEKRKKIYIELVI